MENKIIIKHPMMGASTYRDARSPFYLGRRGQTHLEAILATLIFIGFIFVLLYLIKPFEIVGTNNNADLLITTIPNYLQANVTEIGIKVGSVSGSCFSIQSSLTNVKTYRVESSSETLVNSKGTGSNLIIQGGDGFYNVYTSPEFDDNSMSTSCQATTDFQLASRRTINALSYKKISSLNTTYYENYDLTKEELKIGQSSNWGMIIIDELGREIVRTLDLPRGQINIHVKESSRLMIYENGTMQNIIMRVYSY